jgi:CBS domain containing-hemolysin-like protein
LRDCPVAWLGISVMEFKKEVSENRASNKPVAPGADATDTNFPVDAADQVKEDQELLVTCSPESTLGEAVEAAASRHVHQLWVVDEEGLLCGVVSLTDLLLRVVREAALGEDQELHNVVSS